MAVLHEAPCTQGVDSLSNDVEPCPNDNRYQKYIDLLSRSQRMDATEGWLSSPHGVLHHVQVPACILECQEQNHTCQMLADVGLTDAAAAETPDVPDGMSASYAFLWAITIPRLVMITEADHSPLAALGRRLAYDAFWIWPLRAAPDDEGRKQFLCCFVDDVTHLGANDISVVERLATDVVMALHGQRHRAQHELLRQERLRSETLNLELQQTVRTKDSFMNLAAHELRTPLSALMLQADSAARLLGQDPLNGERLNHKVNAIIKQVERLRNLVEDLLDVSRAEQGRFVLRREAVDVAGLTRKVIERLESSFARAHCELHAHIEGPVDGIFDAMRLDQVISNLVVNALKYGLGKPVKISVFKQHQRAMIVIADQGIGVAPEQHKMIFERYGRAVSERDYGGLGLGLWISQQIVVALGGAIDLTSALGEGATFTVSLPLEKP